MNQKSRSLRGALLALAAIAGVGGAGHAALALAVEPAAASAAAGEAASAGTNGGAVLMAQAAATKTTTTTSTYGGWTVTCNEGGDPPKKVCSANFRVFNKQSNSNILVWLVGFNNDGKLLTEFLTLTDVLIQPGVVVTIDDGKPLKADFVECTTKGCKARLELTPGMVRQMKAAKKATIDMTRLDGQVLQFAMEVPGIDQALAELGV